VFFPFTASNLLQSNSSPVSLMSISHSRSPTSYQFRESKSMSNVPPWSLANEEESTNSDGGNNEQNNEQERSFTSPPPVETFLADILTVQARLQAQDRARSHPIPASRTHSPSSAGSRDDLEERIDHCTNITGDLLSEAHACLQQRRTLPDQLARDRAREHAAVQKGSRLHGQLQRAEEARRRLYRSVMDEIAQAGTRGHLLQGDVNARQDSSAERGLQQAAAAQSTAVHARSSGSSPEASHDRVHTGPGRRRWQTLARGDVDWKW